MSFKLIYDNQLCWYLIWLGQYDGVWYGLSDGEFRASIEGDILTWGNAKEDIVTFDKESRIILIYQGNKYTGELTTNGNILWSEGDVWTIPILGKNSLKGRNHIDIF